MEGFGEKSFANLQESIEKAKDVSLANFVYSLGILNVGLANAKVICRAFDNDPECVFNLTRDELMSIDGIGEVIADSYVTYFADCTNKMQVDKLLGIVRMRKEDAVSDDSPLTGKTVVVTGSLNLYASRKDLQDQLLTALTHHSRLLISLPVSLSAGISAIPLML